MIAGPSSSMVADITAKKWRAFFEAFRISMAVSPASAKTLSEIGISDNNLLQIQIRRKVIVQLDNHKYYLDEKRLQQVNRLRNRLAIIPIAVIMIILVVLLLVS